MGGLSNARGFHSLLRQMDDLHAVLEHLVHVVVLVLHLRHHGVRAVAQVHLGGGLFQHGLALFEALHAVVPDDVDHGGLFHLAVHLLEVEEALIALRVAGGLQGGQQGIELHGHEQGVFHFVLGGAGVDAEAVDGHVGHGGVERLILIVGDVAAVQGVGKVGAEARHVKVAGAPADLLVGREAKAELAVGRALREQLLHRLEDDGDAGLVIGAQQGGAIGADQILSHELGKLREPGGLHNDVLLLIEYDVSAGIVDDLRLDVLAGQVGGGVHVGDEADGGQMLISRRGGEPGVDVAVRIYKGVVHAQAVELVHQKVGHVEFRRVAGGAGLAVVIALAEYLGVSDQAVHYCIHVIMPPLRQTKDFQGSGTGAPGAGTCRPCG